MYLKIKKDSEWASMPIWSDGALINYGNIFKKGKKKKERNRHHHPQKGQRPKKRGKREHEVSHTQFVMEKNRFYSLPQIWRACCILRSKCGGRWSGGRKYQNPNKSQGINNPLMTGE